MTASDTKSLHAIGFMTVVRQADDSLLGGLLLLNHHARPLEFHCTAPVAANRAQQILYGPTLEPYLYGEKIGPALVHSATATIDLLLVDSPTLAPLGDVVDVPIAMPVDLPAAATPGTAASADRPKTPRGWQSVQTAGRRLLVLARAESKEDEVRRIDATLSTLDAATDLAEPFDRIRAAIEEAQRSAA